MNTEYKGFMKYWRLRVVKPLSEEVKADMHTKEDAALTAMLTEYLGRKPTKADYAKVAMEDRSTYFTLNVFYNEICIGYVKRQYIEREFTVTYSLE